MKRLFLLIFLGNALSLQAQESSFGSKIHPQGAVKSEHLIAELGDSSSMSLKVEGKVREVCQAKGCWMTMAMGQDQSMRITFKDYGFFVPVNSSGRSVVIQGQLKKEITPVATQKHFAKDAGKSEAEIAALTEPETEWVFVAEGVLFLD